MTITKISDCVSDGVLDPFKDNFEAGKSKHDLIMKNAKFELAGNYQFEAFHYPDAYSYNVQINFLGIIVLLVILYLHFFND